MPEESRATCLLAFPEGMAEEQNPARCCLKKSSQGQMGSGQGSWWPHLATRARVREAVRRGSVQPPRHFKAGWRLGVMFRHIAMSTSQGLSLGNGAED